MTTVPRRVCKYPNCERHHDTRGYCTLHYRRSRSKTVDMEGNRPEPPKCSIESCERPVRSTGFCAPHYRSRYYPNRPSPSKVCEFEECGKPHHAKGLCYPHYLRSYKGVDLGKPQILKNNFKGKLCLISDCPNICATRAGLCKSHANWASKYPFSSLQAIQILNSGYSCDICDVPVGRFDINVDHDHNCCSSQATCGRCVRGLLCRGCNRAIGSFSENPQTIAVAYRYLTGDSLKD